MSFKYLNLLPIALLITFTSCSDSDGLNRKLKGTYEIELLEETLESTGNCPNEELLGDGVVFSYSNPGKMVFTNKKVIQGSVLVNNIRPYLVYFEYDVSKVNFWGDTITYRNPEYFQYSFREQSFGDEDTIIAHIYMNGVEKELRFVENNKGKITELIQYEQGGFCYINHRITHYVKQ